MIIGVCELYNPNIHGGDNTYMKYKYMVDLEFSHDEFFNEEYENYLTSRSEAYSNSFHLNWLGYENYRQIVTHPKYHQVQIIDVTELDSGELIGVIKTHYIALIQRKWKKIYAERKRVVRQRKNIKSLLQRSLTGKFPKHCSKYI